MREPFRRTFIYAGVRVLILAAQALPRSIALSAFAAVGLSVRRARRRDRVRTEVNISLALPELSRQEVRKLGRKVWASLGRNCVDVVRLPRLSWPEVSKLVEVRGFHIFEEALSRGKGLVVVTGHIGSWELLAAYFSMRGYPLSVIARPLAEERSERLIDGLRRSKGMRPISRLGSAKAAYRSLKQGHILGVLIDQDTSVKGVFCDFFGRPAFTPAGPAVMALHTGAPIVPMAIHLQEDGRQLISIKEPIEAVGSPENEDDIRSVMQSCSRALEDFIRSEPSQWIWMYERWRRTPSHLECEEAGVVNAP